MIPSVSSSFLLVGAVALFSREEDIKEDEKSVQSVHGWMFRLDAFRPRERAKTGKSDCLFSIRRRRRRRCGGSRSRSRINRRSRFGRGDFAVQRPTGVTGAGEGEVRASGEVGGRYNRERAVRVDQGVCGGVIFGEVWDRLHRARGRPVLFAGRDGRVRDTESVGEISRDQEDGRGVDDGFGGQVVGVRGCEREHE